MGNDYCTNREDQSECNIEFEDLSDSHNTSKYFPVKSNFAILRAGQLQPKEDAERKVQVAKNSSIKPPLERKDTHHSQASESQRRIQLLGTDDDPVGKYSDDEEEEEIQIESFKTINFIEFIEFKMTRITDVYQFHNRIDGGVFGDVYKASLKANISEGLVQYRAIKVIPENKANEAIMKEINMLKKLDHPHILKIYEVYRYNKMVYIVTEFLPGGNLMQLISKNIKYSEYYIATIMKQVINGLVYLHSNNIIHRDLKPQNIVFESKPVIGMQGMRGSLRKNRPPNTTKQESHASSQSNAPHSKIIDFGVSILRQPGKPVSGCVGTPYFMAPQVISGCYDQRCDIWSCGVMLYFLLCGSLPFKGSNTNDIFNQILYHKPQFREVQWHSISKSAIALIKNMLNKNKSERYSAKQVLQSEWMKNRKTEVINFNEETLQNLQGHGFKDNFTAIVKTYIASMTTSVAERRLIAEKFAQLDKDNSGFIDKNQLLAAFKTEGIPCPDIDNILAKIDTNKSGKIDFTEFITVMSDQESLFAKERLGMAFEFLDANRTGFIEVSQITQMLKGNSQSQNEIEQILKAFDKDKDNKISKLEFINTMLEWADCGSNGKSIKTKKQIKSKKTIKARKDTVEDEADLEKIVEKVKYSQTNRKVSLPPKVTANIATKKVQRASNVN